MLLPPPPPPCTRCLAVWLLQVIEEALRDPADVTQLSLVYANVSEADIILKDKIDALAAKHGDRLKVKS